MLILRFFHHTFIYLMFLTYHLSLSVGDLMCLTGVFILWIFLIITSMIYKWNYVIFSIAIIYFSAIPAIAYILILIKYFIFSHIIGLLIPFDVVILHIRSQCHRLPFLSFDRLVAPVVFFFVGGLLLTVVVISLSAMFILALGLFSPK